MEKLVWAGLMIYGFIRLCLLHPPEYVWALLIMLGSYSLLVRASSKGKV